jgi:hypothetical protein
VASASTRLSGGIGGHGQVGERQPPSAGYLVRPELAERGLRHNRCRPKAIKCVSDRQRLTGRISRGQRGWQTRPLTTCHTDNHCVAIVRRGG